MVADAGAGSLVGTGLIHVMRGALQFSEQMTPQLAHRPRMHLLYLVVAFFLGTAGKSISPGQICFINQWANRGRDLYGHQRPPAVVVCGTRGGPLGSPLGDHQCLAGELRIAAGGTGVVWPVLGGRLDLSHRGRALFSGAE